jgi:spermidine/putrescine transport system permease protein
MHAFLRSLVVGGVLLFLYLPLAVLFAFSFNDSKYSIAWKGFTLKWYESLLANQQLIDAAVNSLLLAVIAATLATVIGTLGAIAMFRYRFRGKASLTGLLYVLLLTPDIVLAISLLCLFILLGVSLGFTSLVLAHVTFCLPFTIVTVYSRLAGFDNRIIEAARDLGAGEFTAIRRILLPLAMPAMVAGWLLSFTLSLDDVVVSYFVSGPEFEVLPLKIYSMVRLGFKPEVNALATLLFALSLVIVLVSQWLLRERRPLA